MKKPILATLAALAVCLPAMAQDVPHATPATPDPMPSPTVVVPAPTALPRTREARLLAACLADDGHTVRLLLHEGASPWVRLPGAAPEDRANTLFFLIRRGQIEVYKALLKAGLPADIRDPRTGTTALIEAARYGRYDLVSLLIQFGASVNARTVDTGETALHVAAARGDAATVARLLNAHAWINAPDSGGRTPLKVAASGRHLLVARLLLVRGGIG